MKNITNVVFTQNDYEILNSYKVVAEGMADYLGMGYEIALHSLENLDKSVVKICNGHYSGRKEGSPVTDLALSMLSKIEVMPDTNFLSYYTKNKNGEPIKATTITIRGYQNKVIGLLCINFYLNTPFFEVMENFSPHAFAQINNVSENFVENVDDLMRGAFEEAQNQMMSDSAILYANRNKEIISILYQKGIFNLKDAVIKIADLIGISKNTVYMHLRNINDKQ